MINSKIFKASEARANLFKIFKLVASGEDVIVINSDTNERFKISRFQEKPKVNKTKILKKMGEIGLEAGTPEKIKEIILTKYDR